MSEPGKAGIVGGKPDPEFFQRLRKRMLMFYFAAGINLVMALWVMSVGVGQVAGGTLVIILGIFLGFAALNFYMARQLRRQWDAHQRQMNAHTE